MGQTTEYAAGQRWLSNTEPDLGLGVLMASDIRTINLLFPAAQEDRTYAIAQAPITRLVLSEGEIAKHTDGWQLKINHVTEQDGLYIYSGVRTDTKTPETIVEVALDHGMKLNQPEKRLFSGQFDSAKWFDLRYECLEQQFSHATSGAVGLIGARVELIPHQLHIANQVGQRHSPRVLLADEVGLGKTIEAGLILHQQILTGKVKRVLITVPSSLVHQWLVEMLRRVNLRFSVFDEERLEATDSTNENPFEQEQLILCSIDFVKKPDVLQKAVDANWDMLIVDEAHHLSWSLNHVSEEYIAIEALCLQASSVLLLTATPDQLGHESHFARLRLLDPARFYDYQEFLNEESHYSELASAVAPLIDNDDLDDDQISKLQAFAKYEEIEKKSLSSSDTRNKLISSLIDQHGTGRLFFRNTRANIQGFPERHLCSYPVKLCDEYSDLINSEEDIRTALHPERIPSLNESWTLFDPRVEYLTALLTSNSSEKFLVICAYASTALQLAEYFRQKTTIKHSVFHERMSIVERDKAAHYFATEEHGAQVLLCSEIGSEGRNFQFSRHLVLFDLPLNPDLLEQRIGRLDRIGQKFDINIHVPYFQDSAQHVLFEWYDKGLSAFEHTCSVGGEVFDIVEQDLLAALANPNDEELKQDVIQQSHLLKMDLQCKIEKGRDRLLELNASGYGKVDDVLDDIVAAENPVLIGRFMSRLFDSLGVLQEEKDDFSYIIKPTERLVQQIPGLNEEGLEITYHRSTANKFEQLAFLTWDSELVRHCIETVTSDVLGKSSIAFCKKPDVPVGSFWIECTCVLTATAPSELQLFRYLPPMPIKVCLDAKYQESEEVFSDLFNVKRKVAQKLLTALSDPISKGIEQALEVGKAKLQQFKQACLTNMIDELETETSRLISLQHTNLSIRDEEIDFLQTQKEQLQEIITQSDPLLDSVRIIVNNP